MPVPLLRYVKSSKNSTQAGCFSSKICVLLPVAGSQL